MHPSSSLIFFTTSSGAGYGILFWIGLLALGGDLPDHPLLAIAAMATSLALVSAGLLASFWHLGRPERAWLALSQWRTSWLSREGVLAGLTYLPALLLGIIWISAPRWTNALAALGLATAPLALATVGCTAMIYASLRPVEQWNHPLVLPNYLALCLMSGALWTNPLFLLWRAPSQLIKIAALCSVVAALAIKEAYWASIAHKKPITTIETATGLGRYGRVTALEAPHTEQNYLLREMGFRVGRKHAAKLRLIARVSGFILPALFSGLVLAARGNLTAAVLALMAVFSSVIGLLAERWLFFAEAKHTVSLYYGGDLFARADGEQMRGSGYSPS